MPRTDPFGNPRRPRQPPSEAGPSQPREESAGPSRERRSRSRSPPRERSESPPPMIRHRRINPPVPNEMHTMLIGQPLVPQHQPIHPVIAQPIHQPVVTFPSPRGPLDLHYESDTESRGQ